MCVFSQKVVYTRKQDKLPKIAQLDVRSFFIEKKEPKILVQKNSLRSNSFWTSQPTYMLTIRL